MTVKSGLLTNSLLLQISTDTDNYDDDDEDLYDGYDDEDDEFYTKVKATTSTEQSATDQKIFPIVVAVCYKNASVGDDNYCS